MNCKLLQVIATELWIIIQDGNRSLRLMALSVAFVLGLLFAFLVHDLLFKEKTFRIPLYDQNYTLYRDETIGIALACGLIELDRGNFGEAQREFQYYISYGEPDVQAALGMATTLVSRCEKDAGYCPRAKEYIVYAEGVNKQVSRSLYEGSIEKLKERMDALPY